MPSFSRPRETAWLKSDGVNQFLAVCAGSTSHVAATSSHVCNGSQHIPQKVMFHILFLFFFFVSVIYCCLSPLKMKHFIEFDPCYSIAANAWKIACLSVGLYKCVLVQVTTGEHQNVTVSFFSTGTEDGGPLLINWIDCDSLIINVVPITKENWVQVRVVYQIF